MHDLRGEIFVSTSGIPSKCQDFRMACQKVPTVSHDGDHCINNPIILKRLFLLLLLLFDGE